MSYLNFTAKDIHELNTNVLNFLEKSGELLNGKLEEYAGYNPAVNSIAANDYKNYKDEQAVHTVYLSSFVKVETATDHLVLISRGYANPVTTLPTWANVRGILELCASVSWVLDLNITIQDRVNRIYAIRYHDQNEMKKLLQSMKHPTSETTKKISRSERRLKEICDSASKLECPEIKGKNNKIIGIGALYPKYTDLVEMTLGRGFEYRLCSSVTHGSHPALIELGYRKAEEQTTVDFSYKLEKVVNFNYAMYQLHMCVSAISQCLWYWWKLYGWGENEIITFLDRSFDKMIFASSHRVWRN